MSKWFSLALACAGLGIQPNMGSAQAIPAPDIPIQAQTGLGFNPRSRCPDLRVADEGAAAVVLFLVARSGIPSHVSIRSTSGSADLDAAAVSCVLKLRFAPATRPGDGEPIEAWQQMAWRWADRGANSAVGVGSPTDAGVGVRRGDSHTRHGEVTVRVCADEEGKLEQTPIVLSSSGDPHLDEAATKIAASGPQYYRPSTTVDGKPVSGCVELAIRFDTKQ
jgi:TonB family protein